MLLKSGYSLCYSPDHEVAKHSCRPLAECRGTLTIDAVADGDDDLEVVVLHLAGNRTGAFFANN